MFDFVIVNWNSGHHLQAAVDSLLAHQDGLIGSLLVVDNASTDGSTDFLVSPATRLSIELIRNQNNKGFGAGCNQGAARCHSKYLVFFNPDAQLLPETLSKLRDMLEHPSADNIGIVGPQNINEDGSVARSCARFPSVMSYLVDGWGLSKFRPFQGFSQRMLEWDHGESAFVDQVIGAFFVVRRDLFLRLEGFDERFFVYLEEVDFSLRARQIGCLTYYLAEAKTIHYGGGSSENVKAMRLFYSLSSRILYVFKHFKWLSATAVLLNTLTMEFGLRLAFSARVGGMQAVMQVLKGYGLLVAALPRLLSYK